MWLMLGGVEMSHQGMESAAAQTPSSQCVPLPDVQAGFHTLMYRFPSKYSSHRTTHCHDDGRAWHGKSIGNAA